MGVLVLGLPMAPSPKLRSGSFGVLAVSLFAPAVVVEGVYNLSLSSRTVIQFLTSCGWRLPRDLIGSRLGWSVAASVAKWAGTRVFEKHLRGYEPADPRYETYADDNGRQKRRKVRTSYPRIGSLHYASFRLSAMPLSFPAWFVEAGHAHFGSTKDAPVASTPASIIAVSAFIRKRALWP
jgi:hypothetical protein